LTGMAYPGEVLGVSLLLRRRDETG
jgi:hypothetical protein